MRISLAYGSGMLQLDVPDSARVYETTPVEDLTDVRRAFREALLRPLDAAPLARLVNSARCVSIAIPDATRPNVSGALLPHLTREIADAAPELECIDVVVATGSHRAARPEELRLLAGTTEPSQDLVRFRSHDAYEGQHLSLGRTAAGTPIEIDRRFCEADVRLVLGVVEPHLMAGYSGGAKTLCPGLASLATIRGVHRASQARGHVGYGVYAGNPFVAEIGEAAARAKVDFSIQVCVSPFSHRPTGIHTGALGGSHAAARAQLQSQVLLETQEAADVVVTTAGGQPLDRTLYQAAKGWLAGLACVRPGGHLVLAAELRDGIGSASFEKQLQARSQVTAPEDGRDHWMVQHIDQAGARAQLHLFSSLPDATVSRLGIEPLQRLETVFDWASRVIVLPQGPYGIARVRSALMTLSGEFVAA